MPMTESVLLLGDGYLYGKVKEFLEDNHVKVVRNIDSEVSAVIDLELDPAKKQDQLKCLESNSPDDLPIFVSVLYQTATEIASWLKHPERVMGFSPLMLGRMHILEVSLPLQLERLSDQEKYTRISKQLLLWRVLGKEIEIVDDQPALILPRVLACIINEATYALDEGIATKEEIDTAMKYATNFPYGPFEWADELGLEQVVGILQGLHRELGGSAYVPSLLLKRMLYAGERFYV